MTEKLARLADAPHDWVSIMHADPGVYNRDHRKRLQQKFLTAGMEAFHDYEVLELLLTYVIPQQDVKPLAKDSLRSSAPSRGFWMLRSAI